MRRLAAALLRWLAEALVRLYYPRRTIEGAGNIPPGGPALYVVNHPNGLLDPLVLRVSVGRAVRFLAKSTLWGNPFGRLAMDAFGCLPIYRQQDLTVDERGASVARNEQSFARCRAELRSGAELALYPEGTSHSEPQLKPLKSGAARIALSAAAEAAAKVALTGASRGGSDARAGSVGDGAGERPFVLVPVGMHYENKSGFRSGLHMVVGAPIELGALVAVFGADQRQAVDGLTDEIRARLNELVLQAETRELLAGVARVASWTAQGPDDDSPERRHARTKELLAAYRRLRASDPARLEEIAHAARRYAHFLEKLGVRDPWALEAPRVTRAGIAVALGRAVLMAPAAIWGVITSFLPYRLSGVVAGRMTRDEDVLSTIKMIVGATFLVAAWIAEAVAIGWNFGLGWALASVVAAPLAGYAALRLGETIGEVAEAFQHLGWRTRARTTQRLTNRRRRLAEEVARALREAGG